MDRDGFIIKFWDYSIKKRSDVAFKGWIYEEDVLIILCNKDKFKKLMISEEEYLQIMLIFLGSAFNRRILMKNKDWILRVRGKHVVTVNNDGEVRYSIGKRVLFILKKDVLQELESQIKLSLSVPNDSTTSNVIRYKDDNKVFTLYNHELYTKFWK